MDESAVKQKKRRAGQFELALATLQKEFARYVCSRLPTAAALDKTQEFVVNL